MISRQQSDNMRSSTSLPYVKARHAFTTLPTFEVEKFFLSLHDVAAVYRY